MILLDVERVFVKELMKAKEITHKLDITSHPIHSTQQEKQDIIEKQCT